MKLPNHNRNQSGGPVEIVDQFGTATLVKRNGKHELIGGTAADWTAAKEWVSLFDHELTISRAAENPASRVRLPVKPSSLRFRFKACL